MAHLNELRHKKDDSAEGEDEGEDQEEDPVEEFLLLLVYTAVTYGYIGLVAKELQEIEHWETFHDAFYFVFITSTTIGFGDFAPEVSKQWISTHAHILVSLNLMALWLGSAGAHFFKLTPWKHLPSLPTPVNSNSILKKRTVAVLGNSILQSWTALTVSMVLAGLVLQSLEYDLAKAQANEFHAAFNGIINEFRAAELSLIDGSSAVAVGDLSADVEAALDLLNSMGTCGAPPENAEDVDFSFRGSMLYSFYIASTIGCTDGRIHLFCSIPPTDICRAAIDSFFCYLQMATPTYRPMLPSRS
jgi:hypothetical protein